MRGLGVVLIDRWSLEQVQLYLCFPFQTKEYTVEMVYSWNTGRTVISMMMNISSPCSDFPVEQSSALWDPRKAS